MTPVGKLVLCYLLSQKKPSGSAQIRKALSSLAAVGEGELGALLEAGLIEGKRSFKLTEEGRAHALALVGGTPRGWLGVKARLVAGALGVTAVKDARDLRQAVIARHHKLAPRKVLDALAWRQLGVESDRKFDRTAVLAHLLGVKPDGKTIEAQLAAHAVESPRTGAEALRTAVLRGWLGASSPSPLPSPSPSPSASFAERVLAAASASPTGRFGADKVFISHVWRMAGAGEELSSFKQRLVDAQRDGLLYLSRADLVEAMDPDDVRQSETESHGARYHFIRTGRV
jgi:hypothetical protein